jgi:hypothetical protein
MPMMTLRGVRISCDMVARNCDLASLAACACQRAGQIPQKRGLGTRNDANLRAGGGMTQICEGKIGVHATDEAGRAGSGEPGSPDLLE